MEAKGLDGLRKFIGGYRSAFPDLRATPEVIVDGGRMIAVRYIFTGTHKGAIGKVRPTGKKVKIAAMLIVRLSRGKIIEEWEMGDELELMKQIGRSKGSASGGGGQSRPPLTPRAHCKREGARPRRGTPTCGQSGRSTRW